jgi:hypothetical protein
MEEYLDQYVVILRIFPRKLLADHVLTDAGRDVLLNNAHVQPNDVSCTDKALFSKNID